MHESHSSLPLTHFTSHTTVAMGAVSAASSILRGSAVYACREHYEEECARSSEVLVRNASVRAFDPRKFCGTKRGVQACVTTTPGRAHRHKYVLGNAGSAARHARKYPCVYSTSRCKP